LFRTETHPDIQRRILPDLLAEDGDLALAGLQLPRDELHESALACAVGTEQAGDASRHADGHVVQSNYLAVPLRQVISCQDRRSHATISTPRTWRSRMDTDTTTRPRSTRHDTIAGVSYRAACWKIASLTTSKLPITDTQATRLDPVMKARTPYIASAKNIRPL